MFKPKITNIFSDISIFFQRKMPAVQLIPLWLLSGTRKYQKRVFVPGATTIIAAGKIRTDQDFSLHGYEGSGGELAG